MRVAIDWLFLQGGIELMMTGLKERREEDT